jgi:CRISPR-associated protein Csm4
MQAFQITLNLQSAFATPLKGDTLFGQLCWAIRNRYGEPFLNNCMEGYTDQQPFAVVSDAFPAGYLPLPRLPGTYYLEIPNADRKAIKKRCWLPAETIQNPLAHWLTHAKTASEIAGTAASLSQKHPQPHNKINRLTNTTGNGFDPYSIEQEWFIPGLDWSIYLLLDTERLTEQQCRQCLEDIGSFGFGRDASIGLGKFAVKQIERTDLPGQANANSCLTLAPCAPQGLGFDSQYSYYQLFTRFGRHGDLAVHQEGKPFKNPVLLAQTAAIFHTPPTEGGFVGQGIGGSGELSKTLLATVHQGYAPVVAVNLAPKDCL